MANDPPELKPKVKNHRVFGKSGDPSTAGSTGQAKDQLNAREAGGLGKVGLGGKIKHLFGVHKKFPKAIPSDGTTSGNVHSQEQTGGDSSQRAGANLQQQSVLDAQQQANESAQPQAGGNVQSNRSAPQQDGGTENIQQWPHGGTQQHTVDPAPEMAPSQVSPQSNGPPMNGKRDPNPIPPSIAGNISAADQAVSGAKPASRVTLGVIAATNNVNTGFDTIESFSDTYLQPFKVFNAIVTTLSNIHPYAQIALGILTAASQVLMRQVNIDSAVSGLLDTVKRVYEFLTEDEQLSKIESMRDTLSKIAQVINDAVQFIANYSATKSFWKRLGKNLFSETQTTIGGFAATLTDLMQQYRDLAVRDIQLNVYRILEDLGLKDMTYAGGAGIQASKRCLDGTRIEILQDIINWINDPQNNMPRILWLHGQAGRGKSSIAHTIASWVKDAGALGSCFCFSRDRQAERREEKVLATIARDLADRFPAFKQVLADVVKVDHSLKCTTDVDLQWQKFIVEPLSTVKDVLVGNVVIVIDGLDEGPSAARTRILSLFTSTQTNDLFSNFRILLVSRPFVDIQHALTTSVPIKEISLDKVPLDLMERDIHLFVSKELHGLGDIGPMEIQQITKKSDGVFEWARLACEWIKPNKAGQTVRERFDELIALEYSGDGEGRTLLDATYLTMLETVVPKSVMPLDRYRSVMRQILTTQEPLPIATMNLMRALFPNRRDRYDVIIVLEFLASLMDGIADRSVPVRPLHASFYEFLHEPLRSGVYFVDTSDMHDMAFASLRILRTDLKFNICELDSSYVLNASITDLPTRIRNKISIQLNYSCRFWTHHLKNTKFEPALATYMKEIIGSTKILYWFEALSLLGVLGNAAVGLASTIRWLKGQSGYEDVKALARDGVKFIHNFGSMILQSTPHLYLSALPFIPENSPLSTVLKPEFPNIAQVSVGAVQQWPVAQHVLWGHTREVTTVAFSPDGSKLASGSYDGTVIIWDVDRGIQIGSPLWGHRHCISSVAFSHDSKRIASGAYDKTVRMWDVEMGTAIGGPLEGHTCWVYSVSWSCDGLIASGSSDMTIRLWDIKKGQQVDMLEGHTGYIHSVAFSPDGKRIVSGSADLTVRIWDVEMSMQIGDPLNGHAHSVVSVAFSPDGTKVASGSEDTTVRIWDVETGQQIGEPLMGHIDTVWSVAWSPDSMQVVAGSRDYAVTLWDVEKGVQVGNTLDATDSVWGIAFSSDGARIATVSRDKTVRIWDVESLRVSVSKHIEHYTGFWAAAFSPDSKMVVSGSWDKVIRVWDAERGGQVRNNLEGHTGWVYSVAFSHDGTRIVSGSSDNTVRVWDVDRSVQIGSPLEGHADFVNSVSFSHDGTKIVSGSRDMTVRIWDTEKAVQIGKVLGGHTDSVTSVEFSHDDAWIVSGSWDMTIRIWNVEKGTQTGDVLKGHTESITSVAFSHDSKRIASGSWDRTVRIWDVERSVQVGEPLQGHVDAVWSVAFSPDGAKVVSGSWDKTVRVWDVEKGVQLGSPFEGHKCPIYTVTFSSDGQKILSSSEDKSVRVWDWKGYVDMRTHNVFASSDYGPNTTGSSNIMECQKSLYPIHFSCDSSHVLHGSEELLNGLGGLEVNWHEPVWLDLKDGWIKGPQGRLLLWVPLSFREPFYSMWNKLVIPTGSCIELDLSRMPHGKKWKECCQEA